MSVCVRLAPQVLTVTVLMSVRAALAQTLDLNVWIAQRDTPVDAGRAPVEKAARQKAPCAPVTPA